MALACLARTAAGYAQAAGSGAGDAAASVEPAPAPETTTTGPPAHSTDDADAESEPWPRRYTPATLPRRSSLADLEARFGFAFGLARGSGELPRLGAAATYFPSAGRFGVGATLALGPSLRVVNPKLLGSFFDTATSLMLALRLDPSRALRAGVAAGPGLQLTELSGELPFQGRALKIARIVPTANLELRADWLLASELYVGLHVGVAVLVLEQRYFAAETEVFELRRFALAAGLALGAALPE